MKHEDMMRMRRAVMAVRDRKHDDGVTLRWPADDPHEEVERETKSFARVKKIGIRTEHVHDGLRVIRDTTPAAATSEKGRPLSPRYRNVAALELGQEVLVPCEPTEHAGVRATVSALGARRGRKFSCAVAFGGLMVLRPDPTAPPRPRTNYRGRSGGRPRTAPEYDMSALELLLWADFDVERKDEYKVRRSIARAVAAKGWDLMSRVTHQTPERVTLRVHRLDHPARGPGSGQAAIDTARLHAAIVDEHQALCRHLDAGGDWESFVREHLTPKEVEHAG